jgi:hypothetical protein
LAIIQPLSSPDDLIAPQKRSLVRSGLSPVSDTSVTRRRMGGSALGDDATLRVCRSPTGFKIIFCTNCQMFMILRRKGQRKGQRKVTLAATAIRSTNRADTVITADHKIVERNFIGERTAMIRSAMCSPYRRDIRPATIGPRTK